MKNRIVVVDYHLGNTNSVFNAISGLGYNVVVSNERKDIESSDALIMPGVGAFGQAMHNIKKLKLESILNEQVLKNKKPVLGICIGMQIMAESSEENGYHKGLGWLNGTVKRIIEKDKLVPHVGWNEVNSLINNKIFFSNAVFQNPSFYWDHSYHFDCSPKHRVATVQYGSTLSAIVARDNIFGVQFHPEKSQTNGLRLLRSFFNYCNFL